MRSPSNPSVDRFLSYSQPYTESAKIPPLDNLSLDSQTYTIGRAFPSRRQVPVCPQSLVGIQANPNKIQVLGDIPDLDKSSVALKQLGGLAGCLGVDLAILPGFSGLRVDESRVDEGQGHVDEGHVDESQLALSMKQCR